VLLRVGPLVAGVLGLNEGSGRTRKLFEAEVLAREHVLHPPSSGAAYAGPSVKKKTGAQN
jgi:hypothetical protein